MMSNAASTSTEDLIKEILDTADKGLLPQAEEGYEHAYPEHLYLKAQTDGLQALERVQLIIKRLHWGSEDGNLSKGEIGNCLVEKVVKGSCASLVTLCATYYNHSDWSNEGCQKLAAAFLDDILAISSCPSVFRLLCGYSEVEEPADGCFFEKGILGEIFRQLKKRLNKESWKKEPASRQVFHWLLLHMKHPFVGEHLNSLLPPALLFVDDYQPSNKLLGIRCLQHIIKQVDPTELRWYGRSEVIFQALQPLLYQQEDVIIKELIPCLLSILPIMEKPGQQRQSPWKPGLYDKIFQTILCNMEGEQKLALRQEFAKSLEQFISVMKINILRHMKRLLRVISSYLELSDGKEEISRLHTLRALRAVMIEAWPRIPNHSVHLTKVLLTLLCDISTIDSFNITDSARHELQDKSEDCLHLLKKCDTSTVEPAIQEILKTSSLNQFVKESLERILRDG